MNNDDKNIEEFIYDLDNVIAKHGNNFESAGIAGMLLSRVTLIMTNDIATGKELIKFVWEKLDELEQSNPGKYL